MFQFQYEETNIALYFHSRVLPLDLMIIKNLLTSTKTIHTLWYCSLYVGLTYVTMGVLKRLRPVS